MRFRTREVVDRGRQAHPLGRLGASSDVVVGGNVTLGGNLRRTEASLLVAYRRGRP
jgi:hypothetical protein